MAENSVAALPRESALGSEPGASGRPPAERRERLVELYRRLGDCRDCQLAGCAINLVFGNGNADADLMFAGEAPGFHEDQQGIPFVGRAGKLLDELLAEIGLSRGDVFVANVLKHRPPDNRDPHPDEIEACKPHLFRQIELIEPRVVCTLGNFATKLLTGSPRGITSVRGRPQERELSGRTVRLYPILHPAAALRSDAARRQLRDDFRRLPDLLAEPRPEPSVAPPLEGGSAAREPAAAGPMPGGREPERAPAPQLGLFG